MSLEEEQPVVVRMRNKTPLAVVDEMPAPNNGDAVSALHRGLEALQEGECSEETEGMPSSSFYILQLHSLHSMPYNENI